MQTAFKSQKLNFFCAKLLSIKMQFPAFKNLATDLVKSARFWHQNAFWHLFHSHFNEFMHSVFRSTFKLHFKFLFHFIFSEKLRLLVCKVLGQKSILSCKLILLPYSLVSWSFHLPKDINSVMLVVIVSKQMDKDLVQQDLVGQRPKWITSIEKKEKRN